MFFSNYEYDYGYDNNTNIYLIYRSVIVSLDIWLSVILLTIFDYNIRKNDKREILIFYLIYLLTIFLNSVGIYHLVKIAKNTLYIPEHYFLYSQPDPDYILLTRFRTLVFINEWCSYFFILIAYYNIFKYSYKKTMFLGFNLGIFIYINYFFLGKVEKSFKIDYISSNCPFL